MRIKLGIRMSLNEIALATNGTIKRACMGAIINHISTDSRTVMQGDLYFPFKGEKYDGENYVDEAKRRGAFTASAENALCDLRVQNTVDAFLYLASYYKRLLHTLKYTVAITGSVGKTTTKELLADICKTSFKTHSTSGNMNNLIGMPATILSAPENTEVLILELGMNHPGEIKKLSECAMPDIAVITKIGTAHIGYLRTVENIEEAKSEIIYGLCGGKLIVPEGALSSCLYRKTTFACESNTADYSVSYSKKAIQIRFKKEYENIQTSLKWQKHNLECLCCAIAAANYMNINIDRIKKQIPLFSTDIFRQSYIKYKNIMILDDSYNASLESVMSAIDELCSNTNYCRHCAVLGQIFELGDNSADIHYKIGCYAAERNIHPLYLIGPDTKYIMQGAMKSGLGEHDIFFNEDLSKPEITARQISTWCVGGDIILFKGSHKSNLKQIIKILTEGEIYE